MPRLSDTMQSGTIVRWAVTEGQKIKSGELLADIETDKATMEQQSFESGTVAHIAVAAGALPASLDVSTAESPHFVGRATVALATDGDVIRWSVA